MAPRILALLFLCSCLASCGGGGAKTYYMHNNTTLGQELTDLKAAHQSGALSDEEFEEQRVKLLKGKQNN